MNVTIYAIQREIYIERKLAAIYQQYGQIEYKSSYIQWWPNIHIQFERNKEKEKENNKQNCLSLDARRGESDSMNTVEKQLPFKSWQRKRRRITEESKSSENAPDIQRLPILLLK